MPYVKQRTSGRLVAVATWEDVAAAAAGNKIMPTDLVSDSPEGPWVEVAQASTLAIGSKTEQADDKLPRGPSRLTLLVSAIAATICISVITALMWFDQQRQSALTNKEVDTAVGESEAWSADEDSQDLDSLIAKLGSLKGRAPERTDAIEAAITELQRKKQAYAEQVSFASDTTEIKRQWMTSRLSTLITIATADLQSRLAAEENARNLLDTEMKQVIPLVRARRLYIESAMSCATDAYNDYRRTQEDNAKAERDRQEAIAKAEQERRDTESRLRAALQLGNLEVTPDSFARVPLKIDILSIESIGFEGGPANELLARISLRAINTYGGEVLSLRWRAVASGGEEIESRAIGSAIPYVTSLKPGAQEARTVIIPVAIEKLPAELHVDLLVGPIGSLTKKSLRAPEFGDAFTRSLYLYYQECAKAAALAPSETSVSIVSQSRALMGKLKDQIDRYEKFFAAREAQRQQTLAEKESMRANPREITLVASMIREMKTNPAKYANSVFVLHCGVIGGVTEGKVKVEAGGVGLSIYSLGFNGEAPGENIYGSSDNPYVYTVSPQVIKDFDGIGKDFKNSRRLLCDTSISDDGVLVIRVIESRLRWPTTSGLR
jgi:hypothetical protein